VEPGFLPREVTCYKKIIKPNKVDWENWKSKHPVHFAGLLWLKVLFAGLL
jgi:hypothetical protein